MKLYSDRTETLELFENAFDNIEFKNFRQKLVQGRVLSIKDSVSQLGLDFLNNVESDAFINFSEIFIGKNVVEKTDCKILAKKNIKKLSGRSHKRVSFIGVKKDNFIKFKLSVTNFKLNNIPDDNINEYVKNSNWKNVSGSFSMDSHACKHIKFISGCYISKFFVDEDKLKLLMR